MARALVNRVTFTGYISISDQPIEISKEFAFVNGIDLDILGKKYTEFLNSLKEIESKINADAIHIVGRYSPAVSLVIPTEIIL